MAEMIDTSAVQKDIEDIGKAVNEDAVVIPRYGVPFKSIPRIAKEYDQNSGTKGFNTLAEFDAVKATIPAHTVVTIGEAGANQGQNIWDGVTLIKSPYDPALDATTKANAAEANAKEFADDIATEKITEVIVKTASALLHAHEDKNERVYAFYDENAQLRLVDLDGSVQEEINELKLNAGAVLKRLNSDLFHFDDESGNLVAKIDEESGLILEGLEHPVQYYLLNLNQVELPNSSPKSFKTKANLLSTNAAAILQQVKNPAPLGEGMLPQQYHLGENWVKNLTMPVSANRIVIGAYNDAGTATQWVADSGVVHPNVIKFDEPVCGYKYWMGINPYSNTNENYELPYIYGSNSDALGDWTLIPNFAQPFDVDPLNENGVMSGHLSDSCFTYDPINGELWFFWRQTLYFDAGRTRPNAKQTFFAKKTKDGTNWSERLVLYPQYTLNNDLRLSPSIVFNPTDGLFYLYYINLNGSMGYETTESLNNPNWTKVADIQLPFTAWHLDMKWLGDSLVALIHSDTVDQLYVGISRDMQNFQWSNGLFDAATNLYKSSFIPIFNDNNEISLKIVYTTDQNSTPMWQFHTTQTNFTSIKDQ